jgi:hypothetical protein
MKFHHHDLLYLSPDVGRHYGNLLSYETPKLHLPGSLVGEMLTKTNACAYVVNSKVDVWGERKKEAYWLRFFQLDVAVM